MSEAIILFCTIFGTWLAYLTYKSSTVDPLKETKQLLTEKFGLLQRMNSKLLEDLNDYGKRNNSFDAQFVQGLTLSQCIHILEKVKNEILTTEFYDNIKLTNSKARLDDLIKCVEIQINSHSEVRTMVDYFILQPTIPNANMPPSKS
ncbi:hypothetical protein ACLOAU_01685 [Niabella sp. CJ426]|uniref:hypothetical protein n=1 Tax=Niabella sp. CJ426 TaxID=3393740 RepID=UPI003CFD212F